MNILVTGTRTGIGRALAEHLLQQGHAVVGCSRRAAREMPQRYTHFEVDLTKPDEVRLMFVSIKQALGHLDALINSAGTATMAPFMLTSQEDIVRMFELNVFALMLCCREAAKLLRHSPGGAPSIVNLSSVATAYSLEGQLAYAASKAAVEQLTRTLSREFAEMNIRVNALGLPPIRTALLRTVPKSTVEALVARQAIKRLGSYEDLVGPVDFLLSDAARFITGETIFLGGVR